MLGKSSDSSLCDRIYDLINELNTIQPSVLLSVLPQLEFKLKVCILILFTEFYASQLVQPDLILKHPICCFHLGGLTGVWLFPAGLGTLNRFALRGANMKVKQQFTLALNSHPTPRYEIFGLARLFLKRLFKVLNLESGKL